MRAAWAVVALAVACGHGNPPVAPSTVLIRIHVEGAGAVQASGMSLECRSGCEARVASGTVVRFIAQPDPEAIFEGWRGACIGSGACELTVTQESEVTARFTALDSCAGILPASMGTPVSATLPPPGAKRYCEEATSDGQGNVAHAVRGMGPPIWQVYAADGAPTGQLWGVFDVAGQDTGFHGIGYDGFTARSPTGTVLAQQLAAAPPDNSTATWIFPARTGGSVVVTTDSWGCPKGRTGHASVSVWRFDAAGASTSVVDIGGVGCPASRSDAIAGISDDRDNTFIAVMTGCCSGAFGLPPQRVVVRWVDAAGRPLTPWTDVASEADIEVAPVIGGGVVLRAGDWIASFASGSATAAAAPTFIPPYHRVAIVRGGRAYAIVPTFGWSRDHAIELYSREGSHCGTLTFPDHVGLYVGRDGTVISIGPDDLCTATWWPHLLR